MNKSTLKWANTKKVMITMKVNQLSELGSQIKLKLPSSLKKRDIQNVILAHLQNALKPEMESET